MYKRSRFRVLFPTPHAIKNDIQKASFRGFPPRGGWPWSRVPWIGRRRCPTNFGPKKNWMDQIQGWLGNTIKGWYPPKFSVLIFFDVSFFFRMRLRGILKLWMIFQWEWNLLNFVPKFDPEPQFLLGAVIYKDFWSSNLDESSKCSYQSLPISIPPFFIEILKRLFSLERESSWYLPSTSGQLDESKKCHRIGSLIWI